MFYFFICTDSSVCLPVTHFISAMRVQSAIAPLALVAAAKAQSGAWAQCGGIGFTGSTTCVSGYTCEYTNDWYSQCIPGDAQPTQPQPSTSIPATTTTPGGGTQTGTPGSGPGTTLQSGYYWVRAVADPNFHKYLQTNPVYTAGTAILASHTTAGQFNIVDGQLVELISGGFLYGVVTPPVDSNDKKLAVTFSTSKNTYGTFSWSGDALQWTVPDISRPNASAWLVCANQQLFINLGSYGYQTPAGCADQTIHYYNGATANN